MGIGVKIVIRNFPAWILILLLAGSLAACSLTLPPLPEAREAYQTMIKNITALSAGSRQSLVTPSPGTPVPSVTSTVKPDATLDAEIETSSAGRPCNRAAAGLPIDITIPDGTRLEPGQSFSKTWRLVNAGHCTWTENYISIWFSGNPLGSSGSQSLRSVAAPAESIDITVDLVAPLQPGIYQGNWMLEAEDGGIFGIGPDGKAPFWVKVEVVQLDTPSPSSVPQPSATSLVYRAGSARLEDGDHLDLDSGLIGSGSGEDLLYSRNKQGKMVLAPAKGAYLVYVGERQPDETNCQVAALSDQPVMVDGLGAGAYLCYRTNQTLPGYFKILQFDVDKRTLQIQFLTWFIP